ncbi:fungal-specific transcription factor domain-containing protein [Xylogone sp. PMI_703]|nr:fungal-specific transcription factor domain-containing protein [Xylogone sp. PMI_703]
MTLPVACPPASSQDPPSVPQRKRRRRAPATGASDDCFACTKRNTKCDRRRPYCSQCLEIGKECSGYKTQLTWGVGVASRGKLRGLSLPVARSAPALQNFGETRPRATSTTSRVVESKDSEDVKVKIEGQSTGTGSVHSIGNGNGNGTTTSNGNGNNNGNNPFTTYDFINMAPHQPSTPSTLQMGDWNMPVSAHDYAMPDFNPEQLSHHRQAPRLHRLHTLSLSSRAESLGLSSSIDSLSAYSESDYASPVSQSFPDDNATYFNSPVQMFNSYSTTGGDSPVAGLLGDARGPTSCPDQFYPQSEMSSSISSHQNLYDIPEGRQARASPAGHELGYDDDILATTTSPHEMELYATSSHSDTNHFGWNPINDDSVTSQQESPDVDRYRISPPHNDLASPPPYAPEISPRVSFFLDYYEKIICPSVVVMDSPSNPYREHILRLATSSSSLQHAICALAACNLRMKRKQSLAQDYWRQPVELELLDRINIGSGRPTCVRRTSTHSNSASDSNTRDASLQEEYQHRSLAVQLLNQQLSDPSQARHDCVLATLFILCHYRMCESGIAQFRTQFAGVKKILGMRDSGLENGAWGWMETLFTYFDGIAASINDREAQLSRASFLEMIASPSNPSHALENLAGCDAILFKTISKLGRLNMLSQHRMVRSDDWSDDNPTATSSPLSSAPRLPPPPNPRPRLAGQALVDFYNLHTHNFDGNGFTTTLDDDNMFAGSHHNALRLSSLDPDDHEDMQTAFWKEWKVTRLALQEWEFDPERLVLGLPSQPSPNQLRDFGYLSEAFRYAALLYTERLAHPSLPSSHLNFQNLVSQVLFYITSLEQGSGCEKFLLWPLFVAGSEAVNELQRGIVRSRVREIMGRSGYLNNLAGLEVLEKLWRGNDSESAEGSNAGSVKSEGIKFPSGPFKWTRYMDGVDGEWIMF